jgi:ketosteroid isomerase-like protein
MRACSAVAKRDPQLQGAERVREVFARVRVGDATGVADLYADDGVVLFNGGEAKGRAAIEAFYRRAIDSIHPQPRVDEVLDAAPRFIALVEVPNDRGLVRALDLFEVGDAGIERLEIFSRGDVGQV